MNAPPSALFLDAASLRGLVTYEELIEPVAVAFGELSRRLAESGVLSMYPAQSVELGDVLVKTGSIKGHSVYVVKISPWFAANEERRQHQGGFIAVFDAETGHTVAILEDEHYLSDIRTAAAGAVAAQQLAPDEVVTAAVLGAGTQAFWQPQALHRVRPYSTLKIWSRDTARSAQLRLKLERVLPDVEIHIGATAESVVRAADVIMTATSAREPIVHGSWLHPGQHITALGADDSTKAELDDECFRRADRVFVDSIEMAKEQGEISRWLRAGRLTVEDIDGEIGDVVNGTVVGRTHHTDITIAKLVGLGVQDLVAAEMALRARQR